MRVWRRLYLLQLVLHACLPCSSASVPHRIDVLTKHALVIAMW